VISCRDSTRLSPSYASLPARSPCVSAGPRPFGRESGYERLAGDRVARGSRRLLCPNTAGWARRSSHARVPLAAAAPTGLAGFGGASARRAMARMS